MHDFQKGSIKTKQSNYDLDLYSWKPLDNAAKLFPSMVGKYNSTFFRLEVQLNKSVDIKNLQKALEDTLIRYPLFQMRLRRGFFWHFLEHREYKAKILSIDEYEPCMYEKVSGAKKGALWRVLAGNTVIAFEVSHLLTDGKGAAEFLKTLVCQYYECAYKKIKDWKDVRHIADDQHIEEDEESYRKYYKKYKLKFEKTRPSFHYPEKRGTQYMLSRLKVNLTQVKKLAKEHNTTITSFLIAVHLYAVYRLYKKKIPKRKVVREVVPINLRQFFKSKTMRNFFLCVMIEIDFYAKKYNFEKIVKHVHIRLQKELNIENVQNKFSAYVREENSRFNKVVPRFLKTPVLRITQMKNGDKKMIGSLSNLGIISFPDELEKLITDVSFFPPPSRFIGRNITIISYKNTICIGMGKFIRSQNIEKEIAKILLEHNIDVVYLER